MYQKDLIRDAWKSAGLYDENDAKLQQFLKLLDDPTQCWGELIQACRRNFAAYKAKIAQPILGTSDTLVHLTIIRAVAEPDELDLLEQYISTSDPARDEIELNAIALKNIPRLNEALAEKPGLTKAVSDTLAYQASAAPPAAPEPAAPEPAAASPA